MPPVEGWRATSPRAVEKVERSSWAKYWLCYWGVDGEVDGEVGLDGEGRDKRNRKFGGRGESVKKGWERERRKEIRERMGHQRGCRKKNRENVGFSQVEH